MDFFNHYKNEAYLQRSACQLFDPTILLKKLHDKLAKPGVKLIIEGECIHFTIISGQEALLKSQNIHSVFISYYTCPKFWQKKHDMASVFSNKLHGFIL